MLRDFSLKEVVWRDLRSNHHSRGGLKELRGRRDLDHNGGNRRIVSLNTSGDLNGGRTRNKTTPKGYFETTLHKKICYTNFVFFGLIVKSGSDKILS